MKFSKFATIQIILILISFGLKAQDFIVKGVVFEKGSNIRVALAEITNQRTKIGVGSNDLGFFQLKARVGDTLLITKRSLTDQRIVIHGTQDILIYLIRESTMLNEVTIIGNTKKQDLEDLKRDFKNKGVYNGGKSSFLSAIFQPLNGLYNLIGKEPRNARRFGRYADNELQQSQIDVYFNQTIIKNNSELRGDTLEKYMLNCRPEFDKAQYWNSYDYIKYIKESSKKFTDTLGKGK
ncbi:hypothetical protein DU508_08175 [Pedobacter chinensis]|uniref:Carboxypeptidase-like regulatory domain-containing protein n=1 Tax=Pedobacter chinensis TaxID=2282421 RepID=A0A369Q112_9SPHI|nr:hypothetical protein [Pedobacter chinensis]RDC57155.1 hypothetical protein DU508_08175 [Pedobacter chinensis]